MRRFHSALWRNNSAVPPAPEWSERAKWTQTFGTGPQLTWRVCPAGVHWGEVDLFVPGGPLLGQYHLLSLHGAQGKKKKKKKNFSTTWHHIAAISATPFWMAPPFYLVLCVGHGAVKRALLKLKVVRVQLLCEHATWWHGDLGGGESSIFFFFFFKYARWTLLLISRNRYFTIPRAELQFPCYIFYQSPRVNSKAKTCKEKKCICLCVKRKPTTLGSSAFFRAGSNAVVRMYVPGKQ